MVYTNEKLENLVEEIFDKELHCADCIYWSDVYLTGTGECELLQVEANYRKCPGLPDDVLENLEVSSDEE